MIYNDSPKLPLFDDRIIRAADAVFDALAAKETHRNFATTDTVNYILEHRTANLYLPRMSGKTTYISKLAAKLGTSIRDYTAFVVQKHQNMNVIETFMDENPKEFSNENVYAYFMEKVKSNSIRYGGKCFSWVLFDDVASSDIQIFVKKFYEARVLDANTKIFSLSTMLL